MNGSNSDAQASINMIDEPDAVGKVNMVYDESSGAGHDLFTGLNRLNIGMRTQPDEKPWHGCGGARSGNGL